MSPRTQACETSPESPDSSPQDCRHLFDAVASPIFVFDRDNYLFLDCNQAALRAYGYSREQLALMTPLDLHPPEELPQVRANLDIKNLDRPNVYTHLTHGGRRIQVEILTDEIVYEGVPAWISTIHDVSRRERTEAELKVAREQAESASRSKGEFLANVSHEIRTPMNAIIGMTDLALGTELAPEQKEYLEIVRLSADSLLNLVNDILDFSKIEAGKLVMDPIEFSLRSAIGDTLRTLAIRAEEKGLELACRIDPELPDKVVADPGRLRQVIVNLVGNSIKFTEKGEIVVSVSKQAQKKDKVRLLFSVKDTGIGIPKDKQCKIFEAFAQADGSTTRTHGGTGLGLAISSQLVSLMGGQICVESEPGKGSTFSFVLEFKSAEPRAEDKARLGDLGDLRVLVVDDLAINRRITDEILCQWGVETTLVESGREAIDALAESLRRKSPYDLVILDSKLPQTDGFKVADEIRRTPSLADTTILMLTSSARRGDAARCRELGVQAYLTKPIIQSDLLDAIRTALARPGTSPLDGSTELITRHSLRESRRALKILLAEDNAVNQKLALRLLEKRGHRADLAENGREAVELWSQGKYDVILMDVQMPDMDGLAATRAIRQREFDGDRTPVVAMTAFAMNGDRERCLEAGMDDYISKPIKPPVLFEVIERLAE